MSTVGEWLASRDPAPPEALRERLHDALGVDLQRSGSDTAAACLAAGERLLAVVLASENEGRDNALDLLAADALVTYAFEAASEEPALLAARASAAMTRMATLGMAPSR